MYCRNCGKYYKNNKDPYCKDCGIYLGKGRAHCPACGTKTSLNDESCAKCGTVFEDIVVPEPIPKKRYVAGWLGIFLGGFGVHSFYLGYKVKPWIQILATLITGGAGSIWGFIEGAMINVGIITRDARNVPLDFKPKKKKKKKKNGKPVKEKMNIEQPPGTLR